MRRYIPLAIFTIINLIFFFYVILKIESFESSSKLILELRNKVTILENEKKNIRPTPSNFLRSLRNTLSGQAINNYSLNSKYYYENTYDFSKLKKYLLPITNYTLAGNHPTSYFTRMGDKIVIASGSGEFFYININDLKNKKDSVELNYIEDNISYYEASYNGDRNFGIKDITLIDDYIYISHTRNIENSNSLSTKEMFGCFNTSISRSKILIEENKYSFITKKFKGLKKNTLNFEEFFAYDDCVDNYEIEPVVKGFYPLASGGRIISSFNKNKILFSTGTFLRAGLAQDDKNLFGKILEIDLTTKDYTIISKGHRNPQGLQYLSDKKVLLISEHGPKGGDEININHINRKEEKNYGWPISSYGEHYNGKTYEEAPLHKSHKEFGFIEPIEYFDPSIGPSDFAIINKNNQIFNINDVLMGSLSGESIYHIRFNKDFSEIIFNKRIHTGEGVRDIKYYNDLDIIVLTLENSPAIGVIEINDIKYLN